MKIVTNSHQTMITSYCWVSFMSVFQSIIRSNQIIKFGWIFHNFLSLLRKAPPPYQSTKLANTFIFYRKITTTKNSCITLIFFFLFLA